MKYFQIKLLTIVALIGVFISACDIFEVDEITSPNFPNSEVVLNNATNQQLQDLADGLESRNRNIDDWWQTVGVFGREAYFILPSDPRAASACQQYPSEARAEDDHDFWCGAGYGAPYTAVRQANLIILATQNTDLITDAEKNGYVGFAKTVKGYQLIFPLLRQWTTGIRIALPYANPLEPGPVLSYDDALARIREILDEGAAALQSAGTSLSFTLSAGFDGYNTPEGLLEVNRAIAARAAIYAQDWQGALDALEGSFLNLTGAPDALWEGPENVYTGGLDQNNPFFFTPKAPLQGLMAVNPVVINEAEPGDKRVENKFFKRSESFQYSAMPAEGLPPVFFNYQMDLYPTLTSPIPFIRNEELILIYAEAKAQTNQLQDAVDAINIIRSTWGLSDFQSTSKDDIIDQILHERRYSLWMEGHRWVDMRRYDRLDTIDTSLDGGRVPLYMARPQGEIDWECYENPESC